MILTTIRMKVFPEKRKELLQTLMSLVGSVRTQKGCSRCDFAVNAEDENEICLFGEWENRKDLDTYLESELFKVLLGAMSLLKNPHDLKLYSNLSAPGLGQPAGALNPPWTIISWGKMRWKESKKSWPLIISIFLLRNRKIRALHLQYRVETLFTYSVAWVELPAQGKMGVMKRSQR